MKSIFVKGVAALSIVTMLSGCVQTTNEAGEVNKSFLGSIGGAVAGAWIGSNIGKGKGAIVGTAAGTLLGAMAGRELGRSLDRADVAYHNKTQQRALEYNSTGTTSSWKNPDTKTSGTVTPVKTYVNDDGRYCREYTQTIKVGGKKEEAYGVACRQADGKWQIIQ